MDDHSQALEDLLAKAPAGAREPLRSALEAARPGEAELGLEFPAFLRWLASALPGDADAAAQLCVADLYLARACAAGRREALLAFERRYVPEIDAAVRRVIGSNDARADVRQALLSHLFVGDGGRRHIEDYGGRGPLGAWLRVAATRAALRQLRKEKPQAFQDSAALLERPDPGSSPESLAMERQVTPGLDLALREAMEGLPARDQNVLRQHFLDGLTLEELARLHQVHRATGARWLASARHRLLSRVRDILVERSGLSLPSSNTVARMLRHQLRVSLRRSLSPREG